MRVCPSVCVSVCLSTCRFVYYFLCLCLCMCPMYLCTYVCRSELCVYVAVSISVCLSSFLCKCVRGSFHCGRLEIIWKCSPSPLGTFHYLSRLSPFHTSTSNIALIVIGICTPADFLKLRCLWLAGWILILSCLRPAGSSCHVIPVET